MNAVFLQEQTLQFTVFKFHLRYCYMVLGSICASVVSFIIWEIADFEREQELPSGKHYWNIKCKRDSRIGITPIFQNLDESIRTTLSLRSIVLVLLIGNVSLCVLIESNKCDNAYSKIWHLFVWSNQFD